MTQILSANEPVAVAVVEAIRCGDVDALRQLLRGHATLAGVRIRAVDGDDREHSSRTLLHVATDWPGHFPNGPATVTVLAATGADVNARVTGPHTETPLHWAASSDDVDVLDALIDVGADIEAPGAVIAGGTPLGRGAPLHWISVWDGLTPLDAAHREGHDELAIWLRDQGARPASEST
jgi:ankyrin repeat protein